MHPVRRPALVRPAFENTSASSGITFHTADGRNSQLAAGITTGYEVPGMTQPTRLPSSVLTYSFRHGDALVTSGRRTVERLVQEGGL